MSSMILALMLAGQTAAAQPEAPTLQQQFDQASTATDEGRCDEALKRFAAIEQNAKAMANATVRAAVDVRKGFCLIQTGQADAGEQAIRRGLPLLSTKGAAFNDEVRKAHMSLGHRGTARFDYAEAADEYRLALDRSTGSQRLQPLLALSTILAFDQDGEALRYATEARTIALADPAIDKRQQSIVQTQYARVLLNAGRSNEAYAELKDSLAKQGGLTMKVGLAEITTRSDLAIAAWLNNDKDSARRYLAYTGAGRFEKSPFERASALQSPVCGDTTGLKPSDFAIVEFTLSETGTVDNALPIYTTAGRAAAVAFARAVTEWSWLPEDAKTIPAFFRAATRVELRCTMAGERPEITAPLADAFAEWMESQGKGDARWSAMPAARAAPMERAALAQARAKNDTAGLLAALVALSVNPALAQPERDTLIREAVPLATSLQAPVAARTYVAMLAADLKTFERRQQRAMLRSLLADPAIAADPLAAATLRLKIAEPSYRTSAPEDAAALLAAVTTAPGLPAEHPLKVAALLQQANMAAKQGDLATAQAMFQKTGLTSRQCAFLGLKPALRSSGNVDSAYPAEALAMGFEGWLRSEFDVATDGKTIAPRIVVAYPAFVFDASGVKMSNGFRYTTSYRPEDGVACTASQQSVTFRSALYAR